MKFVLDCNTGVKWELPETDSAKACAVLDDFLAHRCELLAPDLFPVEIAHALAKAERQNVVAAGFARPALLRILKMLPTLHPSWPLLPRAIEIASRYRIGVYDCLYVALAEQQQCPLLTADQRLINVLSPDFPFLVSLDALP